MQLCPRCGNASVECPAVMDVEPNGYGDEVTFGLLSCSKCSFVGAFVTEESRAGSLSSEHVHDDGLFLRQEDHARLLELLRSCPAPRDNACACSAHETMRRGAWRHLSQGRFARRWPRPD